MDFGRTFHQTPTPNNYSRTRPSLRPFYHDKFNAKPDKLHGHIIKLNIWDRVVLNLTLLFLCSSKFSVYIDVRLNVGPLLNNAQ